MHRQRGAVLIISLVLLMVLTISMLFTNGFGSNIRDRRITYPQLLTMIEEGQVRRLLPPELGLPGGWRPVGPGPGWPGRWARVWRARPWRARARPHRCAG